MSTQEQKKLSPISKVWKERCSDIPYGNAAALVPERISSACTCNHEGYTIVGRFALGGGRLMLSSLKYEISFKSRTDERPLLDRVALPRRKVSESSTLQQICAYHHRRRGRKDLTVAASTLRRFAMRS